MLRNVEILTPYSWQAVDLIEQANKHFRELAGWERYVLPAYNSLNGVDWELIRQQVELTAQWEYGEHLRYHWRQYHGRRAGPLIVRWPVIYGRYLAKLSLPIPSPAGRALRILTKQRELVLRFYRKRAAEQRAAAPHRRQFLAKELEFICGEVGRYQTSTYGGGFYGKETWHPSGIWNTPAVREGRAGYYDREPGTVGDCWGTADWFWHCWYEFQKAEEVAQPDSPHLDTPPSTVVDLCRPPFEPDDLKELLVRLKVISPASTCLTNDLRGKAQGLRAAFTAAYRVLHREGLLEPVGDKIWATVFLQAYGAKLGKHAISHKLTVHGTARTPASLPFTEAVNTAREWVNEWRSRR